MSDHEANLSQWLSEGLRQTPEVRSIEVDGVPLHVRGWALDQVERPLLLLMHGFRAHARWWDPLAPRLADGYRVASFDFSGQGDSGHRDHYSRAVHAREIAGVADALGGDDVILIGHSFGGMMSLEACLREPGRYSRAILLEIWLHSIADNIVFYPPGGKRAYQTMEAAIERYKLSPPKIDAAPGLLEYVRFHSLHETPDGWRWKFDERSSDSLNQDEDYRRLRTVDARLDFIYGEETDLMDHSYIARLQEIIPACNAPIAIPLAHHHIMIEQPVATLAALRALLVQP